jgi:hypothetical protein
MGDLKKKAQAATTNEDVQEHALTAGEVNYLKLINMTRPYYTLSQDLASGFMYYVATTRLGYKDGASLQFEVDLGVDEPKMTVTLMPTPPTPPEPATPEK